MPIIRISGGYRYGKSGKIYRGKGARKKAVKQGQAIKISQSRQIKANKRARAHVRQI